MKKISILIAGVLAAALVISIPRTVNANFSNSQSVQQVAGNSPYSIELVSKMFTNGAWEWVWSIYNPNANKNTQDLSHWGMQLGSCFNVNDVVKAAYSFNGKVWYSFEPAYTIDPSQSCMNAPVLKFDAGTFDTKKTYYKLVLSKDYPTDISTGYFKSGSNMGCNIISIPEGIGNKCKADEDFWTDN